MDQQRIEDPGNAVRFSALSPVRLLIVVLQKTQVIPSSSGEEDWVPSHARSAKGCCFEALVMGKFGLRPIQTGFEPNLNRSKPFGLVKSWPKPNS
jgi:hypothetical protein